MVLEHDATKPDKVLILPVQTIVLTEVSLSDGIAWKGHDKLLGSVCLNALIWITRADSTSVNTHSSDYIWKTAALHSDL